jgi:hypothetical protein
MHGNITPIKPDKPEPVVKVRTITLTNRAPIKINEDDWPIIAQGQVGEDWVEYGWNVAIRVRRCELKQHWQSGHYIIHANYVFNSPDEDDGQRVRVGRVVTTYMISTESLWKHIAEVGEELKTRIMHPKHCTCATFAIDECFASLPAQGH